MQTSLCWRKVIKEEKDLFDQPILMCQSLGTLLLPAYVLQYIKTSQLWMQAEIVTAMQDK